MVGDDGQAPAGAQHLQRLAQQRAQSAELVVHLDAQRLEQLCHLLLGLARVEQRFGHGEQTLHGGHGRRLASLDYGLRQLRRLAQLAVEAEDTRKLLGRSRGQQVGRRAAATAVHAHVERPFPAEGEPARRVVEMVEAHTQVGKHAVHGRHAVVVHEVVQEAEIAVDHGEARVAGGGSAAHGILVLVKAIEMSVRPQSLQDGRRMTAATIRGIDVHAPGLYVEGGDGLWQ